MDVLFWKVVGCAVDTIHRIPQAYTQDVPTAGASVGSLPSVSSLTTRRSAVTFLFGNPLPVIADNAGVFLDILCREESVASNAGGTYPYKNFHSVLIGERSPFSLTSHFPDRR